MRCKSCSSKSGIAVMLMAAIGGSVVSAMSSESAQQPGHEYIDVHVAMDHDGFTPGETTLVGFTFEVDEGWHTYWPGASDSGFGVTITTNAPQSISVGEPIWPTPHRYLSPGDILDHVYEDEFTVLVPMTLDKDADVGTPIEITSDISYLVCKEMCLPGSVSIEYGAFVLDPQYEPAQSPGHHDRLTRLYDQRPRPLKDARPDASISINDGLIQIHVPNTTSMVFFPARDCIEFPALIADGETHTDTISLHFDAQHDDRIIGRLQITNTKGITQAFTINAPALAE